MLTSDRGEGPRKSTRIYGEVTSVPADRRVVLYADVHPYGRYRRVPEVRVQRDGDYRLHVRPRRDTRYRAGAGGARSRPEELHAYLRKKLDIDQVDSQFRAVAGNNVLDRVGSAKVVPAGPDASPRRCRSPRPRSASAGRRAAARLGHRRRPIRHTHPGIVGGVAEERWKSHRGGAISSEVAADRAVADLAARQHRVVMRPQILAEGLSDRAIARRVARGWLHRQHDGVYSVGTAELDRRGRWMAAVLACGAGAVLSHRDAAALWGILPSNRFAIEVTAPTTRRRAGIEVTRRRLPPDETTTLDGIPVTTVARTLLDLAAVETPARLERALSEAERRRLADHTPLTELFERHPRAKGLATLRSLTPDETVTRSELERRFLTFCRRHGIEKPTMNATVAGLEVDAHWPDAGLVVELDGFAFHSTRRAFDEDRARDRLLTMAAVRVVRVTDRHLTAQLAADLRTLTR